MRAFYDCEFIEDGRTIDLISIGIVTDNGGEYYAVSSEFDIAAMARNPWLMQNVWPSLPRLGGDARMHIPTRTLFGKPLPQHKILSDLFDRNAPEVKPRAVIAREVAEFLLGADHERTGMVPNVELWADYGAYDHVALCQLYGSMIHLPEGVPMFTHDLRQEIARLGLKDADLPRQEAGHHNALADARHNRAIARFLDEQARRANPQ